MNFQLLCIFLSAFVFATPVPAPFCPLCPVIAVSVAKGGLSMKEKAIGIPVAAVLATPFLISFVHDFQTRNMSFMHPNENDTYYAGTQYLLQGRTYGLSSFFHLRTADIYLLDQHFKKVRPSPIASSAEFKVLKDSKVALMNWTIPSNVPSGKYFLNYVSGWSIFRGEDSFTALSPQFQIVNKN